MQSRTLSLLAILARMRQNSSSRESRSRVFMVRSSFTTILYSCSFSRLSVMQSISRLASLAASHWMRNFKSSSPLKAPQPHLPVQMGISSPASSAAPSKPAKALWSSLRTPFLEYWQVSLGMRERSVASMATKMDFQAILLLWRGCSRLNLNESEYPSYSLNLLAPQTITASLSSSSELTSSRVTSSSGKMAKRISSWTQPFLRTPPPMCLLAKSTIMALPQQSSMVLSSSSWKSTLRSGTQRSMLQTQRQLMSRLAVLWIRKVSRCSSSRLVITYRQVMKQRNFSRRATAFLGKCSFSRRVISSPIDTTSSCICFGIIPKNMHPTNSRAYRRVTSATWLEPVRSRGSLQPMVGRFVSSSWMSLGRVSPQKSSSAIASRLRMFSTLWKRRLPSMKAMASSFPQLFSNRCNFPRMLSKCSTPAGVSKISGSQTIRVDCSNTSIFTSGSSSGSRTVSSLSSREELCLFLPLVPLELCLGACLDGFGPCFFLMKASRNVCLDIMIKNNIMRAPPSPVQSIS